MSTEDTDIQEACENMERLIKAIRKARAKLKADQAGHKKLVEANAEMARELAIYRRKEAFEKHRKKKEERWNGAYQFKMALKINKGGGKAQMASMFNSHLFNTGVRVQPAIYDITVTKRPYQKDSDGQA